MSRNPSRADGSEYRKAGRSGTFGQQRQFYGSGATKGGGGAPPAAVGNRSFKKYNNNAQGGQPGAKDSSNVETGDLATGNAVPNGAHQQTPETQRISGAPVPITSTSDKPSDYPTQKITQDVPKAPTSNVSASAAATESYIPKTPAKAPEDASESFSLQFGSISPSLMNGVIPARTSSAPPNLDEQGKAQARHSTLTGAPSFQAPSIPKEQLSKKDAGTPDHTDSGLGITNRPNSSQVPPVNTSKRDGQVLAAPPVMHNQKPSLHHMLGMPMQLPLHQSQVSVQFGGPHPQLQSQTMPGMSLPMPMSLPLGNPPLPHSMFVPGPHLMQTQGMVHHQGQPINFSSQMGPQLPIQIGGNMGMNAPAPPQSSQQSPLKFGGTSRKVVKITHPETHEELRLNSSPVPKPPANIPLQSPSISSFSPNIPMNFYPNSYSGAPVFLHAASSMPLNTTQVPPSTQQPRLYNQVMIRPPDRAHGEKEMGHSTSLSVEPSKPSRLSGEDMGRPQKEVAPSSLSSIPESSSRTGGATSVSGPSLGPINMDKNLTSASASVDILASTSAKSYDEARVRTPATEPMVDKHKKSGSVAHQDQGVGLEVDILDSKSIPARTNLVFEAEKESLFPCDAASLKASNSTTGKDPEERKADNEPVAPETLDLCKHGVKSSVTSLSVKSAESTGRTEESSHQDAVPSTGGGLAKHLETPPDQSSSCQANDVKMNDDSPGSEQVSSGEIVESSGSVSSLLVKDDKVSNSDVSPILPDKVDTKDITLAEHSLSKDDARHKKEGIENSKEIIVPSDANDTKGAAPRGKKKKKDLYRKAEADGTSSDLYMAYKGPEDKKEIVPAADGSAKITSISAKQKSFGVTQEKAGGKPTHVKVEPYDWEDAAEISTPHLEPLKNRNSDTFEDKKGSSTKTYSRDFLLKLKEQCTDLPVGFEVSADVADALMTSSINVMSHPSSGRNIDRQTRGNNNKRINFPGPLMTGQGNMREDFGYPVNVGVRPGQGGNYGGAMRNPRAQTPFQYAGGILSGPLGHHGGLMRNNSDSDRWDRGSGFTKGLMPSPQTPSPVMHRAERKYEVGKVTDEEEAKQRQLKAILNKLTPQNFEKLFLQVKQVNIDNVVTLSGVISQIFDKALMEPTFCEMYANFCYHLAADLPNLSVHDEKITFKRLLLNKCQEEFERGEREEEEANKSEEEGENKQTAEEREEKRLKARRRMLGNIRLIGELYKKRILTERIMHSCINKLLYQNPDEENIESLCKLMSTIGEMIDHPKSKEHIDAYFDMMAQMSNNTKLSSRVRFMLKDSIDLRKNKWQQRRKVEGPKKIEEVHRDAAQERHAQASRLARVPSMGGSARRGLPVDFAPRSPSVLSPTPQTGGLRAAPPQQRGYGSHDVRMNDRHYSLENQTASVPLPQRALGDHTITLGPKGGLARGMAFRGQPSVPNVPPMADMPNPRDALRVGPGQNGFGFVTEQMDRSLPTPDRSGSGPLTSAQGVSSEKVWPEEVLREKSMSAIKEFYSARDENELALCIKELNDPTFYPIMVSIWVTDSFERKGMERDLLTKLLINLTKPHLHMISEEQLIKGFESVLEILEDAVNDAPKAAEFLGHMLAKTIMENVVSLSEIGRLIREGGEEPGRLVEVALGSEVLGSILDIIKEEKGDDVLNEILSTSNLQLDNFRPTGSNKTFRIDRFI